MKTFKYLLLIPFFQAELSAQEVLRLSDAISMALQNNYNLQIASGEMAIARNNVTRGNAGMLPEVSLNAGMSFSGTDTKQEFVTGNEVDKKGAQSNAIQSGLQLNWTLFDGMKMFITYDKLKALDQLSILNTKMRIEQTVAEIINGYYEVVRQMQLLKANDQIQEVYTERLNIAKTKWELGSANKSEYLQARLDLHAQRALRFQLEAQLIQSKQALNLLIVRDPELPFEVEDLIPVDTSLTITELVQSSKAGNVSFQYYQVNQRIQEFSLREQKAARYPNLQFNANYNFSRTDNQAGFLLYNQNLGWNTGLSATWNLFQGWNVRRNIQNSKISLQNAELMTELNASEVRTAIYRAYTGYQAALERLRLESENAALAEENVSLAMNRFRLGNTNSLELKYAQQSLEDSLTRIVQTRYEAKLAETELLRLKGELIR
ncbi:MAG TPA: TolC family protein [Saprospiraceae bacterium]|nr:TolC family protein [Saprospiraceae bacterium]